ncbi:MAG: hypothetical protein HZB56_19245 [Deltaproteobacteria bacterium]|nr:hypothetical protein [Deltaproteobacteria bacterium]
MDGKALIRAPRPIWYNQADELWPPVDQAYRAVATRELVLPVDAAVARLVLAVEPGFEAIRRSDSNPVLCLPNGLRASERVAPTAPPQDLVSRLRDIRHIRGCRVVRMCETGYTYLRDLVRQWFRENTPHTAGRRARRLSNTAVYLAMSLDHEHPVITADLLVLAHEIAIVQHGESKRVLAEAERQLRAGGTGPTC